MCKKLFFLYCGACFVMAASVTSCVVPTLPVDDTSSQIIEVHTTDLADDFYALLNVGLGYDWDEAMPEIGATGAPGFGESSFYSNVRGPAIPPDATDYPDYSALRIRPQAILNLASVTLADLDSISFWSKQHDASADNAEARTWQLKIYTWPMPGVPGAWYDTRFNATLIYYYNNTSWKLNSTSEDDDPATLITFNKVTDYGSADVTESPPLHLSDIAAGSHKDEEILYMDIIAGDGSGTKVDCYLDGVTIKLKDGTTLVLDLGD